MNPWDFDLKVSNGRGVDVLARVFLRKMALEMRFVLSCLSSLFVYIYIFSRKMKKNLRIDKCNKEAVLLGMKNLLKRNSKMQMKISLHLPRARVRHQLRKEPREGAEPLSSRMKTPLATRSIIFWPTTLHDSSSIRRRKPRSSLLQQEPEENRWTLKMTLPLFLLLSHAYVSECFVSSTLVN
jgi:hypothetical protein